ncbi:SCO2523 family variant P-loop protein [Nocardia sp. NBC_00403]|uniref:SCO2523 family variant P-loop protein n=1 Tax=Nocardia sp. NBC_00403 TaxID=2975990 RepID=UPI002E218597
MLVFSTSDKGGAGRSVTSCNLAYRLCLSGKNSAYLDFTFGSPTAGALFEIDDVARGATSGGLHSYLLGGVGFPAGVDVPAMTDRAALRSSASRSAELVLFPGDEGGAEFLTVNDDMVHRCADLLSQLERTFEVVVVDLSAGRSAALELALRATALPQLRAHTVRWLVFHRWSRQPILAAAGLMHGPNGLLRVGREWGHDAGCLLESVRYVRTAVPSVAALSMMSHPAQAAWLADQDAVLERLASSNRLGASALLGTTPVEPVLQWREQVILDVDVDAHIANPATADAFVELAHRLLDDRTWESF